MTDTLVEEAHSNTPSDGLASLLSLLDRVEDSSGAATGTSTTVPLVDQHKHIKQEETYVWDKLETIETEKNDDAVAESKYMNITENVESLKSKVQKTVIILEKRNESVRELKASLARKKVGAERKMKKLSLEWDVKMQSTVEDFEQKKKNLEKLCQETRSSVEQLGRKKSDLIVNIEEMEQKREQIIRAVKKRGKRELQKEIDAWNEEEKLLFLRLAKEKAIEMKKEAAKALEPELRRVVDQHQSNLEAARTDVENAIETERLRLEREYSEMLESNKSRAQDNEELALLSMDESHQKKKDTIIHVQDKKLEDLIASMKQEKVEMENIFDTKIDKKKNDQREDYQQKKKMCKDEIINARKILENDIKDLRKKSSSMLSSFEEEMNSDYIGWKSKEMVKLDQELKEIMAKEEKVFSRQCDEEISNVQSRLETNLKTKKLEIKQRAESAIKEMKRMHEEEIGELINLTKLAEIERESNAKEEQTVTKKLNELQCKLTVMEEDLNDKDVALVKAKSTFAAQVKNHSDVSVTAKLDAQRQLQLSKTTSSNLEKELGRVKLRRKHKLDVTKVEMEELRMSNGAEVLTAREKIDGIINRKKQALEAKRTFYSCLQSEERELEFKLETMRRVDITSR